MEAKWTTELIRISQMKMNEQLRTQTDRDERESSGVINDPMDDLMMRLRQFRQLAKAERMKRKEQIQLKRKTESTRINISERSNDNNGASKIWTSELISQMKVNELLQLKRDIKHTQTGRVWLRWKKISRKLFGPMTKHLEYQMKSNYKTTSTTPCVNRETNLMRHLTARLKDGYCH